MQQFFDLPSSLDLSSDLEWMLQSGQVDDVTLAEALIREYYGRLCTLFGIVFEEEVAIENCLQQTFAIAVSRRHTYRAEMGVRNWLYAQALHILRRNSRLYRIQRWIRKTIPFLPKPTTVLAASNASDSVWIETLRHLGEENRMLIFLHLGETFSTSELAEIYKQPEEIIQGLVMSNLTYLLFLSRKVAAQEKPVQVERFRERLVTALQASECYRVPDEAEMKFLTTRLRSNVVKQPRRAVVLSFKELALSGGVLLAAMLLWFFSGALDFNLAIPQVQTALTLTPSATVYSSPTSTPTPTPEASPTPLVAVISKINRDLPIDFSTLKPPRILFAVNNSGPVALSLVLQSWGWQGDADRPRQILQPDESDRTVLPYEILAYVNQKTEFQALLRLDGDIGLVCDLANAGYPVIVQRGITSYQLQTAISEDIMGLNYELTSTPLISETGETDTISDTLTAPNEWYGIYEILTECNVRKTEMSVWRSSPGGVARYQVVSWEFDRSWWAFDNLYILVYPKQEEANLMAILAGKGQEYARDHSDEYRNFIDAVETTSYRVYSASTDLERFYAWFNRGTALTYLDDYAWAASAFDMAFEIYDQIPLESRPWRITWYNTRPYWAYFYTGRYQDVIDLATVTLETPGGDGLEESYYWRALAREALGDLPNALVDMQKAVALNRFFMVGIEQLARMTE